MEATYLSDFGTILLFLIGGALFIVVGLLVSKLIRPHKPNPEKLAAYECGEEAMGSAWVQFNPRFYVVALIFIIFDVELVFMFPWAVVFGRRDLIEATNGTWGWFALTEMVVFIAVLALGLAYAWAKGHLDWIKPKPIIPTSNSKVPAGLYQKLNQQRSVHKKPETVTE